MTLLKFSIIALILTGCVPKADNEMEVLSEQVLKRNQGVDIEIKPLQKQK
jgi:hypothetical protein